MTDDAVFSDDPLRVHLRELDSIPAVDQAEEIACIEEAH